MKILIENKVAIKLKYYTHFASGEVSGMGKSTITEDGDILVIDIKLFDQECSGASTEIDDKSLAKFMHELNEAGESLAEWNLWWHTHADFGTFWSSTDDKTIADHAQNSDYLISIVTNKDGDIDGRLDVFPKDNSPFKKKFSGTKFDIDVEIYINEDLQEKIDIDTETLEEEKKTHEDLIEDIDEKIIECKNSILTDAELEKECEQEVEDKVREKTYQKINNGVWKKFKSKKKQSYYEKNEEKQKDFEETLDKINLGRPVFGQSQYNQDYIDDIIYNKVCPDCDNMIVQCECPDAYEKYGHFFKKDTQKLDDYLDKQFNDKIDLDDYYEQETSNHCRHKLI